MDIPFDYIYTIKGQEPFFGFEDHFQTNNGFERESPEIQNKAIWQNHKNKTEFNKFINNLKRR